MPLPKPIGLGGPAPFPLSHQRLDFEESILLAEIDEINQATWEGDDLKIVEAIKWCNACILTDIDRWRRELLIREWIDDRLNAKKRPPL